MKKSPNEMLISKLKRIMKYDHAADFLFAAGVTVACSLLVNMITYY